jgi:membrane associated rhomboid family serine protease
MYNLPAGIRSLLLINVAVFALQMLGGAAVLENYFALWPIADAQFEPWQLLTYGFLHASPMHLLINMFMLWMSGTDVERVWGRNRFLTYYLTCVVSAGLTQLLTTYWFASDLPTVGASGGVFGSLLAYALLFPRRTVYVYFAIPMPAWVFVALLGALELFAGVNGSLDNVAHFAHLGGMLGGFLLIRYGRSRR